MKIKLGINIDHVATLRQARGIGKPDIAEAAKICLAAGADFIVCHLRGDRRHIQDADVFLLKKKIGAKRIHLEMACTPEMERIALKLKPRSVCIVPERPDELTTHGGLALSGKNAAKAAQCVKKLRRAGIGVSLFIEPSAASVRAARAAGSDTVELCTKAYAEAFGGKNEAAALENLEVAAVLAREMKLHIHSGHGLDYRNVRAAAHIEGTECLNIGFSVISRAMFAGLGRAVAEMKTLVA
ncbi:MAG: pyridoxine 5'-phosphate synthase [Elusimicrobiales bacterium]